MTLFFRVYCCTYLTAASPPLEFALEKSFKRARVNGKAAL